MNAYDLFETDKNLESGDGVTLDYGDFQIRIHRAGGANTKFGKALEALQKKHRRQLEMGTTPDDVISRLNAELYADSIIIGWVGVEDRVGNKLAFTRENVIKVLLDLPGLFRNIRMAAAEEALFLVKQKDEDLGKSVPASDGN